MAQQLLEARTPAAYTGVEGWARKHEGTDAGSLAWLVLGYAHYQDRQFDKAEAALLRAQPHAGELDDYVAYFLAGAYLNQGKSAQALDLLKDFSGSYPDSLFTRDAALMYANALVTSGNPQRALAVLAPYSGSGSPEIELALGRAYLRSRQTEKGVELLRRIYFTQPASPQAAEARAELEKLSAAALPAPTLAERRLRADLLMQARRYSDAAGEYRNLLSDSGPERVPDLQLALAAALIKAGNRNEAKQILERLPNQADEPSAHRNSLLVDIAKAENNEHRLRELLDRMRQSTPASPWLAEALTTAGRMYWLRHDYGQAATYYTEFAQRFPASKDAAIAHWKAAWLAFRAGKTADARAAFEEQVRLFPGSPEVSPALYWRARIAEDDHDLARARAWYDKLTDRFRNYYYGELARTRLAAINPAGEVSKSDDALLARIPAVAPPSISDAPAPMPADNLRVQKSRLLENGALYDFAVRELQLAASEEGGGNWVTREIIRVYQAGGHWDRALSMMKRRVPGYFAFDFSSLPRTYWETLFPRPYWNDLQRFSTDNQLDPFLVASLIRQESEFNPAAVSPANALGLMQVLPTTGKQLARELHLGHFSSDELFAPSTNLQLGTYYFRELINKHGGVEYALAAYNAGSDRVEDWTNGVKFRDAAEFVESIPFTETREYVQAVIRNSIVYRRLYSGAQQQARAGGSE